MGVCGIAGGTGRGVLALSESVIGSVIGREIGIESVIGKVIVIERGSGKERKGMKGGIWLVGRVGSEKGMGVLGRVGGIERGKGMGSGDGGTRRCGWDWMW